MQPIADRHNTRSYYRDRSLASREALFGAVERLLQRQVHTLKQGLKRP
jgi:hypothetical protein